MRTVKDVYIEALKRRNDKCDIPLENVFEKLNFTESDMKDIVSAIEEDDD